MNRVGLLGAGEFAIADHRSQRIEEMIFDAAYAALASARLDRADVDAVVLSASDELDGRSISSMLATTPAGGLLKDVVKITDSGLHALAAGVLRILSGASDVVLVVSWGAPSEGSASAVEWTSLEPFAERPVGAIEAVACGVMARAYVERHDLPPSVFDAALERKHIAGRSPRVDLSDARAFVAWPLRREHFARAVDGAAAVLVASEEIAMARPGPLAWIRGMGWATDAHSLGERAGEYVAWPALATASEAALRGADRTIDDLEFVEADNRTVLHEILSVEAVGAAPPGRGPDYLNGPGSERVNVQHGGVSVGVPPQCSGLTRIARLVAPASSFRTALVTQTTGICGQGHAAVVLEGVTANG